ncbi:MAG: hypothetical protein QHJ81_13680 [Anaerolineae bacterium]|nr:hypothetical protein [Anaerolineae bacterium]
MPVYYARYELDNGYIHNWLLAGPQAMPVPDLHRFAGKDWKLQIARQYYTPESCVTQAPVQDETLDVGGAPLTWRYYRCSDDHFVDCTAFYHTCHYLRAWAYSRVMSPAPYEATCVLTTNGPADIWLNGQHVHRQEHFHHQIPYSVSFRASLAEGPNDFLVRFEEVAARECPYVMALRIVADAAQGIEPPPGVFAFVPTSHEGVARREIVERAIEAAYLDRDVFVWDDEITVHWPEDLVTSAELTVRLQTPTGWIYSEARPIAKARHKRIIATAYQVPEGPFHVFLIPSLHEYYEGNLRLERKIPLIAMRNRYSQSPYGTFDERRAEALTDAARRETNVFSEIAKMALGLWADVKSDVIRETIEGINQRKDCSDFYLVGLLGMLYRYGDNPSFPESLRQPLEECVLNFRYWADEPGADSMWFWSENHQILFHTCQILAGRLYPDRIFTNAGQTGQWHRQRGEERALSWLLKRGAGGFSEWDSNCYFEEDLLALSHLADLAESQPVYDLATVIMDKMFLTMALNSYRGTFGSTHGRTYTPHIKGARGEATAGISRLMWGMGVFNDKIMGTVSLACMENYGLPRLIGDIAADLPEEMWNRERHAGTLEEWCDRATGDWEVNKVTYKTPDYMLCSAQDYHPGERGVQQHIWQATLGPDAVVFVTHPPCMSEENSHRPSFWHGNVTLPRVAQWKDVLIAIHKLPDDDWLGFTHAYFPLWAFDEHVLRDGDSGQRWAFARKGDGYLALTAARGLQLVTGGDSAYRELRSYGLRNVWLCHMGRAALDGDFGTFQDRILALDLGFGDLSVRCTTLRGETLAFAWEGPLTRNGQIQAITGFKHYDNPYCVADLPATQMEVRYGDQALRLNLAAE